MHHQSGVPWAAFIPLWAGVVAGPPGGALWERRAKRKRKAAKKAAKAARKAQP